MPLRRRFWERVIDGPIGALVLAGAQRRRASRTDENLRSVCFCRRAGRSSEGHVGAGRRRAGRSGSAHPQALRALQDADVVFYDELVSPEILDRARRDAARVPVGRRADSPAIGQDAINALLIEAARSGQRAVAPQGGVPLYSGRGAREEVEACVSAGHRLYSIVLGITRTARWRRRAIRQCRW